MRTKITLEVVIERFDNLLKGIEFRTFKSKEFSKFQELIGESSLEEKASALLLEHGVLRKEGTGRFTKWFFCKEKWNNESRAKITKTYFDILYGEKNNIKELPIEDALLHKILEKIEKIELRLNKIEDRLGTNEYWNNQQNFILKDIEKKTNELYQEWFNKKDS